ncbi:MAG: flagellar motor stator protein MotA [Gemmatimonadetes bacterium]|nr:flagellar motor stator protein MotA [Gemmatimonadota bacterium]
MILLVGLLIVFGSIVVGYTMHHGDLKVLWQISEFVIIGGAGIGALIGANKPAVTKGVIVGMFGLLKRDPYSKNAFLELLQALYGIFYLARKEGLVGIEPHVENPEGSDILTQYKLFMSRKHGVDMLCDTMKVLLTGAVEDHHLAEILDADLESHEEEAHEIPHAVTTVGDAMPGFGIVAAVLGVIITMGKIGGSPEVIGKSVAAALVGTFVGILLAYGVFQPIGNAMMTRVHGETAYLSCIRTALLSFARGDSPMTSVEFARRNIPPHDRPSFKELEELVKKRA